MSLFMLIGSVLEGCAHKVAFRGHHAGPAVRFRTRASSLLPRIACPCMRPWHHLHTLCSCRALLRQHHKYPSEPLPLDKLLSSTITSGSPSTPPPLSTLPQPTLLVMATLTFKGTNHGQHRPPLISTYSYSRRFQTSVLLHLAVPNFAMS